MKRAKFYGYSAGRGATHRLGSQEAERRGRPNTPQSAQASRRWSWRSHLPRLQLQTNFNGIQELSGLIHFDTLSCVLALGSLMKFAGTDHLHNNIVWLSHPESKDLFHPFHRDLRSPERSWPRIFLRLYKRSGHSLFSGFLDFFSEWKVIIGSCLRRGALPHSQIV